MWNYEKRLEYPINIKETNPKIAKFIMSQYGGPYCTSLFFEKNKPRKKIQGLFLISGL